MRGDLCSAAHLGQHRLPSVLRQALDTFSTNAATIRLNTAFRLPGRAMLPLDSSVDSNNAFVHMGSASRSGKERRQLARGAQRSANFNQNMPYQKEQRLLQYVLDNASPGDPASVCAAIEKFGEGVLGPTGSWLKIAGDAKARVLESAILSAPRGGSILEIGTYCGFSSIRMSMALPGVKITSLEVDPVHVIIARNVIAFAGLSHMIDVWTGHSKDLLPRLAGLFGGKHVGLTFSAVFMDQKGSRYDEDLALMETHKLLVPGAVIIADNVLKPGAPLFLWKVVRGGPYESKIVRLKEFAMPSEDWMSISVRKKALVHGQNDTFPEPPVDLVQLNKECDRMREKAIGPGRSVTFNEWAKFAELAKTRMAKAGIVATDDAPNVGKTSLRKRKTAKR